MKLSDIKITPLLDSLQMLKITDKEYFGPKYRNYISNSRLNLLKYNKYPDKFFAGLVSNSYMPCFEYGSAVHELILQPDYFQLVISVEKPTAKAGALADYLYEEGKIPTYKKCRDAFKELDYFADSYTNDKADKLIDKCKDYWKERAYYEKNNPTDKELIYLSANNITSVSECVKNIQNNQQFQEILQCQDGINMNEMAILLNVKVEAPDQKPFIFKLKSKLDNFIIQDNEIQVNDLKTTGKPIGEFNNAIENFSYYRELAMYSWLLKFVAESKGIKNPRITGNFLTVESFPMYNTQLFPISPLLLNKGLREFSHLLRLAAFYSYNGYGGLAEDL